MSYYGGGGGGPSFPKRRKKRKEKNEKGEGKSFPCITQFRNRGEKRRAEKKEGDKNAKIVQIYAFGETKN